MIEVKFSSNDVADILKQMEAFVLGPPKVTTGAPVTNGLPVYEADADDEAEVNPEAVQGIEAKQDSAGEIWNPDIHSPNQTQTKDGRWRLKKGAVRPDASPTVGAFEPEAETVGSFEPEAETVGAFEPEAETVGAFEPEAETGPAETAEKPADDEDEFAAFAAAMQDEPAEDEFAGVAARTWTDADLAKLGNEAVRKLGNPDPVKALIAKFTPEDQVAHSRNIPTERREDFAQEVEKLAGITYAG